MLETIIDALLDAVIDTAKLLPILFVTYLAMEALEHYAGERTYAWIKKARTAGPVLGALIGLIPQCGFAGGAAGLYAAGAVSLGTLIAVFVATSDEMIPILISEGAAGELWQILGIKLAAAVIAGFAVDIFLRLCGKGAQHVDVCAVCERDGCDCCEHHEEHDHGEHAGDHHGHDHAHGGILLPALRHTVKIGLLILAASALMGVLFCFVGEDELSHLPVRVPVLGEAIAALFGLIPNCSVSVLLTKLYTSGVIGMSQMMAGLCANGGVGLLVLYRLSGNAKKNAAVTATLWGISVVIGLVLRLF